MVSKHFFTMTLFLHVLLFGFSTVLSADVVTDWNEATLNLIRSNKTSPPWASRTLAMVHVAMLDAINSIEQEFQAYRVQLPAPEGASSEAAGASAAHRILSSVYPNNQADLDAALAASLAALPNDQARADGVALGQAVADEIIAWRSTDGSDVTVAYTPGTLPGQWRPTPTDFAAATLPHWGMVTPWTMTSGSQFRPGPPPELSSPEWAENFIEVKALGSQVSTARTPDQTEIALFWCDSAGTETPPGHWNSIAQSVSAQSGYSLTENARLFALLNIALADAAISSWDFKFTYNLWRPITAICEADTDSNPDTVPDPSWVPLIATPPFPEYTSGHSTFSASAATVLTLFTIDDQYEFNAPSDGLPGIVRTYPSFRAAADEAGRSRIYGGIHYQFSNEQGQTMGNQIGERAFNQFVTQIEAPPPAPPLFDTLCPFMAVLTVLGMFLGSKMLLR